MTEQHVAEAPPLNFTEAAAQKVGQLIAQEGNSALKLRVYVQGGGCSGFQYGFTFDEEIQEGDTEIEKAGVTLLVDPMSVQYLMGAVVAQLRRKKAGRLVRFVAARLVAE